MTFRCNEKRTHICIQRLKKITKHFCVFEWLRESWNTLKSYAIDVSAYDLHIFELCSLFIHSIRSQRTYVQYTKCQRHNVTNFKWKELFWKFYSLYKILDNEKSQKEINCLKTWKKSKVWKKIHFTFFK